MAILDSRQYNAEMTEILVLWFDRIQVKVAPEDVAPSGSRSEGNTSATFFTYYGL